MCYYVINGKNKVKGEVTIQSAKNAVLPMMACAILTDEEVVIKNCPDILDVQCMIKILQSLGAKVTFVNGTLTICCKDLNEYEVVNDITKEMRSSIYMLGALCSRFKKAKLSFPGGCNIGKRPIDLHISSLSKLGIRICLSENQIYAKTDKITGTKIALKMPSVGATENIILASVFCQGETVIYNAAKEPEILDFMNFLIAMGADISGGGTAIIKVRGVKRLKGVTYTPIPDRIETATFCFLPLLCGGEIFIKNCNFNLLTPVNKIFENYTCNLSIYNDIINMRSSGVKKYFGKPVISTGPYPEYPTDVQPQTAVLFSVTNGEFLIKENLFESRFSYLQELAKMGANVKVSGNQAIIKGVKNLTGTTVTAKDLRGGASLVLAGAAASGTTIVKNVDNIERGYANFVKKLNDIGVDIVRKDEFF